MLFFSRLFLEMHFVQQRILSSVQAERTHEDPHRRPARVRHLWQKLHWILPAEATPCHPQPQGQARNGLRCLRQSFTP